MGRSKLSIHSNSRLNFWLSILQKGFQLNQTQLACSIMIFCRLCWWKAPSYFQICHLNFWFLLSPFPILVSILILKGLLQKERDGWISCRIPNLSWRNHVNDSCRISVSCFRIQIPQSYLWNLQSSLACVQSQSTFAPRWASTHLWPYHFWHLPYAP